MKILSEQIISSTDIIKNYKACRDKTKSHGRTIIFRNNVPDMVLMSIEEYNKICDIVQELENIKIYDMIQERKDSKAEIYSIDEVRKIVTSINDKNK